MQIVKKLVRPHFSNEVNPQREYKISTIEGRKSQETVTSLRTGMETDKSQVKQRVDQNTGVGKVVQRWGNAGIQGNWMDEITIHKIQTPEDDNNKLDNKTQT